MGIIKERWQAVTKAFAAPDKNALESEARLARQYLRNGNIKPLVQDWSKVYMSDRELYTGYPYAAINNRANKVAQLAAQYLHTDATKSVMMAAKAAGEEVMHPYLELIDESDTFSNYDFWYNISTFLDLEGVYYLAVVRTVEGDRVGNIQEFVMLNPYYIQRVLNKETGKVGGYVENRDGLVREFPVAQIIEVRKLNPFSDQDPFAMTDAAKDSQYTMKQAGDYTRHSLKNNMAAPGILSTDVVLEPEMFRNFVNRVTKQEKGLPLFGNGSGAIEWNSMQIDMDKAALDKINEINRQTLFAVSGVGKTMLSIEESGTTRDTARAQKEIFIENHVMPQLQLILDALNQDYKRYYKPQYTQSRYRMYIDNPLGSDREAEGKDIENRDKSLELYDKLVGMGYARDVAAKYALGTITLEELGEPTEEPRPNPIIEAAMLKAGQDAANGNVPPPAAKKKDSAANTLTKGNPHHDPKTGRFISRTDKHTVNRPGDLYDKHVNEFDDQEQGIIAMQQGALQNAVVGIETRLVTAVLNKVTKNAFDEDSDIINKADRTAAERELDVAMQGFYSSVMPLFATRIIASRVKEFSAADEQIISTGFTLGSNVREYIADVSNKVASSHVGTVLTDLRLTIKNTYDDEVQRLLDGLGRDPNDADLQYARQQALEGASQQRIVNAVKAKYGDITQNRAKAVARTETNRAFSQSQYQADWQFLQENGLMERAYKQWTTRSDNPCAICQGLAQRDPIPFTQNFADIGQELSAVYTVDGKTKVLKQLVNFEALDAGNAHVNCSCIYMLIIK
jgi:hypothetical protein